MPIDDDQYLDLIGNITALNLLLRGLYTKWALEDANPRAFNAQVVGGILTSMRKVDSQPRSETEERVWQQAEAVLDEFRAHVDLRLGGPDAAE